MKMEQTECSETSAYKIQTLGNYPKESIQHSEHGKSLKSRIAWFDYQKAFDSIPQSWIEKSVALVGVNSKIVRFCKLSVEKWNTRLHLKTNQEVMQSQPIQIPRGIFQEDCLLPFLFCIALIPLTNKLNRADNGYQVHGTERK